MNDLKEQTLAKRNALREAMTVDELSEHVSQMSEHISQMEPDLDNLTIDSLRELSSAWSLLGLKRLEELS